MFTEEKLVWHGVVTLVVRDSKTGDIKKVIKAHNAMLSVTFPHLGSLLFNNPLDFTARTMNKCGLGSANGFDCADTDISGATESRTLGRFSQNVCAPAFNLSFSFTAHVNTISLGQVGLFFTLTGGNIFLKATFTRLTVNSQNLLQVTWLNSFASV